MTFVDGGLSNTNKQTKITKENADDTILVLIQIYPLLSTFNYKTDRYGGGERGV